MKPDWYKLKVFEQGKGPFRFKAVSRLFYEKLTNKLQDCKEYSSYVNSVVYTTG